MSLTVPDAASDSEWSADDFDADRDRIAEARDDRADRAFERAHR